MRKSIYSRSLFTLATHSSFFILSYPTFSYDTLVLVTIIFGRGFISTEYEVIT